MAEIPRAEHPRPDLRRADEWWLNLNGTWQFEIDRAVSGEARGYASGHELAAEINVPFCPESRLSGIGDRDFLNSVWYRRMLKLPKAWRGRRVLLHLGACDYLTTVWLNGRRAGDHEGGYTPVTADLTEALKGDGKDELVVRAIDEIGRGGIPRGKQSDRYDSYGCLYTRTTGIWQTAWLEAVPRTYVENVHVWPDFGRSTFAVDVYIRGEGAYGGRVEALAEGKRAAAAEFSGRGAGCVRVELKLDDARPWSPADPFLYEIVVELKGEGGADRLSTWGGLRRFCCEGTRLLLNDEPIFLRTVLDQGFYPDGIYTAPSVKELESDIDASMAFGFNGARLHQKLFEPLFLHLCDRKGYLLFGEYADWGRDFNDPRFMHRMLDQWTEALARDLSHPAIIGWCPLNETDDAARKPFGEWTTRRLYRLTKTIDPSRPALDTSGYWHYETDVFDTHDYNQDVESFRSSYAPLATGDVAGCRHWPKDQLRYEGRRPYFVSEYGGIAWREGEVPQAAWGYGKGPATREDFLARFRGLTEALLFNRGISGFCYTQLTDVEQEINGLLTYDRRPKFPPAVIAAILRQKAAVEG